MNVELLKQLGNIGQIAGIRESRLLRGRGEGIAIAEFYNAAGLRFTVVPDRCMDLFDLSYKGVNLGFQSKNGLVTTMAASADGTACYALEGSVFNGGSTIQWLRDELHLLEDARDSEYMAQKVRDTNGCYVVPAFTGLGAPHWDQYARGTIVGLTRGVNKNHIIRATLDSLCYQINDVLAAMQADSGIDLTALKVDGGACANNYLLQTMADISNLPVKRPCCVETTALGAAYLAGLAVGYWSSTEDVLQNWSVDREFMPGIPDDERTRRLKGWNKAVRCSYGWAKED